MPRRRPDPESSSRRLRRRRCAEPLERGRDPVGDIEPNSQDRILRCVSSGLVPSLVAQSRSSLCPVETLLVDAMRNVRQAVQNAVLRCVDALLIPLPKERAQVRGDLRPVWRLESLGFVRVPQASAGRIHDATVTRIARIHRATWPEWGRVSCRSRGRPVRRSSPIAHHRIRSCAVPWTISQPGTTSPSSTYAFITASLSTLRSTRTYSSGTAAASRTSTRSLAASSFTM